MNFNLIKATESVKLILLNFERHTTDFHKILKILYFAEQRHIAILGVPIFNDSYIAMKNGPVPSNLYDIFKIIRGNSTFRLNQDLDLNHIFEIKDGFLISLINFTIDLDVFSAYKIECLIQSVEENKLLDFKL